MGEKENFIVPKLGQLLNQLRLLPPSQGQTLTQLYKSWEFASVDIHSFEPSPNNFDKLFKTAQLLTTGKGSLGSCSGDERHRTWQPEPNPTGSTGQQLMGRRIELWNFGLGPKAGELTFYCPDDDPRCLPEYVSLKQVGQVNFQVMPS